MNPYHPYLQWIDTQHEEMVRLVKEWASINTHAYNLEGLARMTALLKQQFQKLEGTMDEVELSPYECINNFGELIQVPLGKALTLRKRPQAPIQVFLGGHMDTVFPSDTLFNKPSFIDKNTLRGPGVADLKGGLAILLKAVEAFERSPYKEQVGWEIVINPDEEIGSPGSASLLKACASHCGIGLIFEPALPDGAFVSARKGAAKFTLVIRGRSAHVGRDYPQGRSAIRALATFILQAESLNDPHQGTIVNIGKIDGGEAANIVPALAIARIDVRASTSEVLHHTCTALRSAAEEISRSEGLSSHLYGGITRPPKEFDVPTQRLFEGVKLCAESLGQRAFWRETGGVCDGNILAEAGLPTIDTLGAVGGGIHTPEEFILLDSLTAKAKLTALILMKLSSKEIPYEK